MDELQEINDFYSSPESPSASVIRRQREQLMTMIDNEQAHTDGRTHSPMPASARRRRRKLLLLAAPVAAIGLAAAGWTAFNSESTQAAAFSCQSDDNTVVLDNDGTSPLDACRAIWASGTMAPGVTDPELVECVSEAGLVAVIVQDDTDACAAAGMSEWTGQQEYLAVGAALRDATISFHDRFDATGNGCATIEDWETELGGRLDQGADGWTIEAAFSEPGRDECFALGTIDPSTETVEIIGVEDSYSIGCDPRTGC